MRFPRSCGTLVHPTSFPGKYSIGDFGNEAREFLDFLADTGQKIWQVLPLVPTGYGHSPYAGDSAFAGNTDLISIDLLVAKNLLTAEEATSAETAGGETVAYDIASSNKKRLFPSASARFYEHIKTDAALKKKFETFKNNHRHWLPDYCLFAVCSHLNNNRPWNTWESDAAFRQPEALKKIGRAHKEELKLQTWLQFEFYEQWQSLKEYANKKGIRVVGDIPIFVDHNSADVWANPQYFEIDSKGNNVLVAGVPPDYFSKTGQLWGNPLYNWEKLEEDGYAWWVARFTHMFKNYDAIRVDHFRGFEAYWEINAAEKTAKKGSWVKGPGEKLFDTVKKQCGELPIIAEDLGFITEGVKKLRDKYDFPGMKILQFAFGSDSGNAFLPHNFSQNCVVYTGTHDNDTSLGWYQSAPEIEKHRARLYTRSDGSSFNFELIRLAFFSVADQAIIPLQDFMNLGSAGRMNTPGTASNNWLWRYTNEQLHAIDAGRIRDLIKQTNR